jgi:RNA polymerase sigma-70 factor (ECF subfamily)
VSDRDGRWADLMRAASKGDEPAYRRLLEEIAPALRSLVTQGLRRSGMSPDDAEDIVQETLLSIHLKRHTWRENEPFSPWMRAIARNKLIDNLRRRGRATHLPLDDYSEFLAAPEEQQKLSSGETSKMLSALNGRSRQVVEAIAVEGLDAREAARRLGMSEGAIRVALHRGLTTLAHAFRDVER